MAVLLLYCNVYVTLSINNQHNYKLMSSNNELRPLNVSVYNSLTLISEKCFTDMYLLRAYYSC